VNTVRSPLPIYFPTQADIYTHCWRDSPICMSNGRLADVSLLGYQVSLLSLLYVVPFPRFDGSLRSTPVGVRTSEVLFRLLFVLESQLDVSPCCGPMFAFTDGELLASACLFVSKELESRHDHSIARSGLSMSYIAERSPERLGRSFHVVPQLLLSNTRSDRHRKEGKGGVTSNNDT